MRDLRYTGQFKKDLKHYLNQPKKLKALNVVLDMLKKEIPLPKNIASIRYKANIPVVLNAI